MMLQISSTYKNWINCFFVVVSGRWGEDQFRSGADPLSRGHLALSDDGHRLLDATRVSVAGGGLHHGETAATHHLAQSQLHGPTARVRTRSTTAAGRRNADVQLERRGQLRQPRQLVPSHPHAASALDWAIFLRNGIQLSSLSSSSFSMIFYVSFRFFFFLTCATQPTKRVAERNNSPPSLPSEMVHFIFFLF